jgi:hypothetical protein
VSTRLEHPLAAALVDALDDAALGVLADRLAPLLADRLGEHRGDEWLDARGAARYLGLSLPALHRLTTREARAKPGGIPAHQDTPGGKLWFLRSELDQWRRGQGSW